MTPSGDAAAGGLHVVVAAAIARGEEVLLCHRHPSREWYPDVWDLPGGHVEAGETPEQALPRELREELAIEARPVGEPIRIVDRAAGFDLRIWRVDWSGSVANRRPDEHDEIGWFSLAAVAALPLADRRYLPALDELMRLRHGHRRPGTSG